MRVIGGQKRGHKLRRVPGDTTRPITDRVKENLFNILGDWVVDTYWLDLFAGTGQVGIEALSRGAGHAVFLDNARPAIKTIHANLEHTHLSDSAMVLQRDALTYLGEKQEGRFDVIFVAPPQYKGVWRTVLELLDAKPDRYLAEDGVIIVQIDPKEYVELSLARLALVDQRRYGRTMLCFYELGEDGQPDELIVS